MLRKMVPRYKGGTQRLSPCALRSSSWVQRASQPSSGPVLDLPLLLEPSVFRDSFSELFDSSSVSWIENLEGTGNK